MKKYLVIYFDRYNTEGSEHKFVNADSPLEAIEAYFGKLEDFEEFYKEQLIEVDEIYSCVPDEEFDILIYLIKG